MRRLALLVGLAFAASCAPALASTVTLTNHHLALVWNVSGGQVTTASVTDLTTGRDWATAGAPEFTLTVDSVPTSSLTGWSLLGVRTGTVGGASQVEFRYGLGAGGVAVGTGLVELDRTWRLYPDASVAQVTETLVDHGPAALRIGQYALASLTSGAKVSAEVETYHGGSDWRHDFRVSTDEAGTFDDEGEVARFDDGSGAGWFLVGQRRSGSISRVGRASDGTTTVGVDNARDAFDWGPLMSSPPNYNRLDNPAYPVPVRQRTLLPLTSLDLGVAYLGVYHGGAGAAGAAFASDFAAHVAPAGRQTVDLNSFHPWGHGTGMSDANLRPQAALLEGLGGEVFMLDDQWQGSSAGDWNWDPSRFPTPAGSAVPSFVGYLHSIGLQLGLWMSPAEFNPGAAVYKAHPDWACTPVGDATAQAPDDSGLGVWDMTNPSLQAHLSGVISRLIAQDGVREFKFDYVTWLDCPPHDYLDYEDAYVHWVQAQERAHPGVTFELDETNDQRLWPLRSAALGPSWFDNGHLQGATYPARLLHDLWSAAPWIPPSTLAFGALDGDLTAPYTVDYLMPISLLGHVTFWSDLTKLSAADAAELAWWVRWYKAHRGALAGAVYEDTSADPVGGQAWVALQPWRGRSGYLFLFSQGGATATRTIALQAVDPARSYSLTDVRTGAVLGIWTGAALRSGIPFTLAPYTAQVLAIKPG